MGMWSLADQLGWWCKGIQSLGPWVPSPAWDEPADSRWPRARVWYSSLGDVVPGCQLRWSVLLLVSQPRILAGLLPMQTPPSVTMRVSIVTVDPYLACMCDCVLFSL